MLPHAMSPGEEIYSTSALVGSGCPDKVRGSMDIPLPLGSVKVQEHNRHLTP